MAVKSLLINNIKEFHKKLANNPINYLDIDYNAISPEPGKTQGLTKTRTRILHGDYAILNAYRMWLQSRKYDYIRAPAFGGIFDANLNDKFQFHESSEPAVADYLKEQSAINWPQIELIDVEVKAEIPQKNWKIKFIARDKQSGLVLMDELHREVDA